MFSIYLFAHSNILYTEISSLFQAEEMSEINKIYSYYLKLTR